MEPLKQITGEEFYEALYEHRIRIEPKDACPPARAEVSHIWACECGENGVSENSHEAWADAWRHIWTEAAK